MGAARCAPLGSRFHPKLQRADRARDALGARAAARHCADRVPSLDRSLWPREHAQWPDPARSLAQARGAPGDSRLLRHACGRGLSPDDIHDARRRCRGGESSDRVLSAQSSGRARSLEPVEEGHGLRPAAATHEHWHIDISYVNVAGTFCYLSLILDGAMPFLVQREVRERMTTADVEVVIQRAREQCPDERPRIISDSGPQLIAPDFKGFIRVAGTTDVRRSPLLSAIEREARALSSNAQGDHHSPEGAGLARPSAARRDRVCRVLQSPPAAQCDRLHHAGRYACGPRGTELGDAPSEARNGASPETDVVAGAVKANHFAESRRTDDRRSTHTKSSPRIIHASASSNHHSSHIRAESGHSVLADQGRGRETRASGARASAVFNYATCLQDVSQALAR